MLSRMTTATKRLLRIQYASDLHLELVDKTPFQPILKPNAPVLALAGDIGRPDRRSYEDFLHYCSRNWAAVFIVAGNHEFYNSKSADKWKYVPHDSIHTVSERIGMCEVIAEKFPNVHFLNRHRVDYGGIAFLGATLWTNTRGVEHEAWRMNDYKAIAASRADHDGSPLPLTVADTQAWHERDRTWLAAEIAACEEAGQPAVVLTHHLPTFGLVASKYARYGDLNRYFASACDGLIREPVRAWIAGHSHTGRTIHCGTVGGRTITCTLNPRGYPGERETGYCSELFVDVDTEWGPGPDTREPALVRAAADGLLEADTAERSHQGNALADLEESTHSGATAGSAAPPAPQSREERSQSLEWV
jgi:hypothetical protein